MRRSRTRYVVSIPTCEFAHGYKVKAGDDILVTSQYTNRHIPGGHNWHEVKFGPVLLNCCHTILMHTMQGVMALGYIFAEAAPAPALTCKNWLFHYCGSPPYRSGEQCDSCAKYLPPVFPTPPVLQSH